VQFDDDNVVKSAEFHCNL